MKKFNVQNTYQLPISGKPSTQVNVLADPDVISVSPESLSLIKPKLLKKQGEKVQIGTPLFFDKRNPDAIWVSPAAGVIKEIVYGPRRVILRVDIERDKKEAVVQHETLDDAALVAMEREALVDRLIQGGLWSSLMVYPFKVAPKKEVVPHNIYVTVDQDDPFLPESDVYFDGQTEAFLLGVTALKKLTTGQVFVGVSNENQVVYPKVSSVVTHIIEGAYPANDPGVFIYHNKTDQKDNSAWGLRAQDVIRLGQFLSTGTYPIDRIYTVGGPMVKSPCHVKSREGVSVEHLLSGFSLTKGKTRFILGGILTGRQADKASALSVREYGLNVLQEGQEQTFLSFMRLGAERSTVSRTYLGGVMQKAAYAMSTVVNGGHRACISCSACPEMCPVGLYPQLIMKSLHANEMEEAVQQGLLDCVDCGLCTYVCPSKIELGSDFETAKKSLFEALEQ